MMKRSNYFTIAMSVLAAVLVIAAGAGSTIAYFTTYAETQGGKEIRFSHSEEIHEEVTGFRKSITITSEKDSQPAYIRARAYVGNAYELYYEAGDWTDGGDGWYYYKDPISGGESTTALIAGISDIPEKDLENGEIINIVVVFESTLALYRQTASGDFESYANWNEILDAGSTSYDGQKGGN